MELIEALRQQIEWGADEALLEAAQDRRAAPAPAITAEASKPAVARIKNTVLAGPADAERIAAGCMTLAALETACAGFSGCALRETATRLVFGEGAENARLMLVGDAPGAEEDRAGTPFVGPAGQLLDRMLASIGQDRGAVRIANIVPWRPPGDRHPTEGEIALCLPFLRRQIALVQPDVVLLLGAVATKAMFPEPERHLGIRRLRGHWREISLPGLDHDVSFLPSYHPAYLLRMPAAKAEAWRDLLALKERLESGFQRH